MRRNGVVSFIRRLGRTSARRIAPVETGLQSLELFCEIGVGSGVVLYKQISKKKTTEKTKECDNELHCH